MISQENTNLFYVSNPIRNSTQFDSFNSVNFKLACVKHRLCSKLNYWYAN